MKNTLVLALLVLNSLSAQADAQADAQATQPAQMIGCWVSEKFDATSLLTDAADLDSASVVMEKMLLKVETIPDTEFLVIGRIYEWDEGGHYVLGPSYQNGAYNPTADYLTFGFPDGALDHVTQNDPDRLLYVHAKSAVGKSAMSVRLLKRLPCADSDVLESDLLRKQDELQ